MSDIGMTLLNFLFPYLMEAKERSTNTADDCGTLEDVIWASVTCREFVSDTTDHYRPIVGHYAIHIGY